MAEADHVGLITRIWYQKRLTLGTHPAMSLSEARIAVGKAQAKLEKGQDPADDRPSRETVAELVETYVERHARTLRTGKEEERRLRADVLPALGHVRLTDLSRRQIADLLHRKAEGAKERSGNGTTANRPRSLLQRLLNKGIEWGHLESNPAEKVGRVVEEASRARVLTDDELRRLWTGLQKLPDYRTRSILQLLVLTGQRVSEVAGMIRSEVNLDPEVYRRPNLSPAANRGGTVGVMTSGASVQAASASVDVRRRAGRSLRRSGFRERPFSGSGVLGQGWCDRRPGEGGGEGLPPPARVAHDPEGGEVGRRLLSRDAAMRPRPGAQRRPEAFRGVDLRLAGAVVIARVPAPGAADRLAAAAPPSGRAWTPHSPAWTRAPFATLPPIAGRTVLCRTSAGVRTTTPPALRRARDGRPVLGGRAAAGSAPEPPAPAGTPRRRAGAGLPTPRRRGRRRARDGRQHRRPRPPARRRGAEETGSGDEAVGRGRGGLSTGLHAAVDALGGPTGLALPPGRARDLGGADASLPDPAAGAPIADKAHDAEERGLGPLARAGRP